MSGKKDIVIEANSNFHNIAGKNILESDDACYQEYRRKWKEWPETFKVGDFPLFIDVEVTSACNLKCPFCATTFRGDKIKKGFVTFDMVKEIIDEGAENGLYGVKFNIRGEPLMHPEIHEFVSYAKQKGLIDVYFNTNAALMSEEISRKLIDSKLDRLSISFEGYTKEVYEKNRVGSNFEKVLENIETMQALKKKRGVQKPYLRVQTVVLPDMEFSLEEYKEFWKERVDEVSVLDYKEMKHKKKGVSYSWACPQLWQRMAIWWDGTVLPCNHDDDGLLAMGKVGENKIKDIWHSDEMKKMRDLHKQGLAHKIPACDGCYLRDSEISKIK